MDASEPQADILALYTRLVGSYLDLRIDMLDIPVEAGVDLEIIFIRADKKVTLLLPVEGNPVISDWSSGLHVDIERDPGMDTITLRLNRLFIPRDVSVQVKTHLPGQEQALDATEAVSLQAPPPPGLAGVLLAFWDVFPATTPAQALRRWDGAHTGPYGRRHGLSLLLRSVEKYQVPVFLLDLLNPASLAALQFTDDALAQVKRLADGGLVALPLAACGQPADVALSFSRQSALDFGLPYNPFIYTCGSGLQPGYIYQFISLDDSSQAARAGDSLLLPLPTLEGEQATAEGPSLEVRRLLVEAALSPSPADFVTLGGSLPGSTWAGSDQAAVSLAWLAGHPWINVLDSLELIYSSFVPDTASVLPSPPVTNPWLEALLSAPENSLTHLAWQMNLLLTSPTPDENLGLLRQAYAGQVGVLLEAAAWAEDPYRLSTCSTDPDRDGQLECLLANEHYFGVIEKAGARLTHLFLLDESGPHQVIAPTTQFTIGLSDASLWQPALGDAADPGALVGAFSDMQATYAGYESSLQLGVITLGRDDVVKTFRLTTAGLEVAYASPTSVSFRIPLVVDPQAFYSSTGTYLSSLLPGVFTWGVEDGLLVEVRTDGTLTADGFTSAQASLASPEDPDAEYPYMHYFPFPFSLVTVTGGQEVVVTIGKK